MKRLDPTVARETVYIAVFTALCSVLMQAVFLVIGRWNVTVLLGNILGACAAVGNFLLMGITVQSALGKDEKDAKGIMKLSQSLRLLMLFVIAMVGYLLPVFHTVAVILPYLFPRFAIALRPFLMKDRSNNP